MEKIFLPGDLVKYGFGTISPRTKKYTLYNTVCIVKHIKWAEYEAVQMCGDVKLEYERYFLEYDSCELLFTFHPEKHKG